MSDCPRGQKNLSIDQGNNTCCLFLNVTDEGFTGIYKNVDKLKDKPEDECINGCIYIKVGGNDEDKYCFEKTTKGGFDTKCEVSFLFEDSRYIKDLGKKFNNNSLF